MCSYKYGLIDGNYFLRRNFSAAKRAGNLVGDDPNNLTRSFLCTVLGYKEKINFDKTIVVWDYSPYKKLLDITEYKQNRHYATREELLELNELIEKETDTNKKLELIAKRDALQYDLDCEKVFADTKNALFNGLDSSSITNIRIKGYEADDLAYLISSHLSKNNESCILVTADSDWLAFVQGNVTVYKESRTKGTKYYTINESPYMAEAEELQCSAYVVGNLMEAYTGGHNNVDKYSHSEIPFIDFARKLLQKDLTLPDYEYFWKRVAALNIENYDNDIVVETFNKLMAVPIDNTKATELMKSLGWNMLERFNQAFKIEAPPSFGGFVF